LAHSNDDFVLRRNDIQPLRTILTDLDHIATATGANNVFGIDDPLDARQPLWKGPRLALLAGLFVLCSLVELVDLVLDGLDFLLRLGDGGLLIFECQFQLIGAQLFRLGSELGAPMIGHLTFQLLDQRFQLGDEDVLLSADSLCMLPRRALYSQLELLRFKGPHDLGRQARKLANIERL
jgi:hypothetical protein